MKYLQKGMTPKESQVEILHIMKTLLRSKTPTTDKQINALIVRSLMADILLSRW